MFDINQIKKEMIKLKKTDKDKSNTLMLLIDTAQKIAKEKQEEIKDTHIIKAAKKLMKIAKDELNYGIEKAKKDIEILKNFIPKPFDKTQLKHIIIEYLNDHPELNTKKAFGKIIGNLKEKFGEKFDPKAASEILNEIFKK